MPFSDFTTTPESSPVANTGSDLKLTCAINYQTTAPALTWWKDGEDVTSDSDVTNTNADNV